jgi:hypothetical protein
MYKFYEPDLLTSLRMNVALDYEHLHWHTKQETRTLTGQIPLFRSHFSAARVLHTMRSVMTLLALQDRLFGLAPKVSVWRERGLIRYQLKEHGLG